MNTKNDNFMLKMIDDFIGIRDGRSKGRIEDTELFKYFRSGKESCKSYLRIEALFEQKNKFEYLISDLREMLLHNTRFKYGFSHADRYGSLDINMWEVFKDRFASSDYRESVIDASQRKRNAGLIYILMYGRDNIREKELTAFLKNNINLLRMVCEDAAIIEAAYDAALHRNKYERSGKGKAQRIIESVNAGSRNDADKDQAEALMERLKNCKTKTESDAGLIICLASAPHTLTSLVIVDNLYAKGDGKKDKRIDFADPMAKYHYAIFNSGYVSRRGNFSEAFDFPHNDSYEKTYEEFKRAENMALADLGDFEAVSEIKETEFMKAPSLRDKRLEYFKAFLGEDACESFELPKESGIYNRRAITGSGAAFSDSV